MRGRSFAAAHGGTNAQQTWKERAGTSEEKETLAGAHRSRVTKSRLSSMLFLQGTSSQETVALYVSVFSRGFVFELLSTIQEPTMPTPYP